MGKTTENIKISLNVSLIGSPKGVIPTKKNWNQNFHFKIRKKTLFFIQKLKIDIFTSKVIWAPNCEKIIEKALFVIKKRIFC